MIFDPEKHHRRSIRLKGYDYSQLGYYFVTICTQNRECFFGTINASNIKINDSGKMINKIWKGIPIFYRKIMIDEYIIMPNHIHGIIKIDVGVGSHAHPSMNYSENKLNNITNGQAQGPVPTLKSISLPNVIERFKSLTTKQYIDGIRNYSWRPFDKRLWQRNYYERIIRNDKELNQIREYIKNNPFKWDEDENNPINIK